MEHKENKVKTLEELQELREKLIVYKGQIEDYLKYIEIVKRNKIDQTVAELIFIRGAVEKTKKVKNFIKTNDQFILKVKYLLENFFRRLNQSAINIEVHIVSQSRFQDLDAYMIHSVEDACNSSRLEPISKKLDKKFTINLKKPTIINSKRAVMSKKSLPLLNMNGLSTPSSKDSQSMQSNQAKRFK